MKTRITLVLGLALGCLHFNARAATRTWTGAVSSDFYDANNWAPAGFPAMGDVFDITNSTVVISPAFTFTNQVNWTGGNIGGGLAIAPGAVLAISGPGTMYLSGQLTNAGTVAISGRLQFQNYNVTLANQDQGLVDLQGDVGIVTGGYPGQQIVNAGAVRKSGGGGLSPITGIAFLNGGTVEARSGTLDLQYGGTLTGACTASSGAAVTFSSGSFALAPSAVFGGGGFIGVAGGAPAGAPSFGGTLATAMSWTNGTIGGNWTIAITGSLAMGGTNTKFLAGSLTNNGTITLVGPLQLANYNVAIVNQAGALFDLQGDLTIGTGYPGVAVVNAGTFRKSGGSGALVLQVPVVNSGQFNIASGSFTLSSSLTMNGGTVNGTMAANNGILSGSLNGAVNWTNGTLSGPFEVAANGLLTVGGPGPEYLQSPVTNWGTIALTSSLQVNGYNLSIANQAGALIDLQGDVGIISGGYPGQQLVNAGTLRKSAGTGASPITGIAILNSGTMAILSGEVSLTSPLTNSGGGLALRLNSLSDWTKVVSSSSVGLGGPLQVGLAGNFAPPVGQKFQIVSGAPVAGTFSQLSLPTGLSVVYSNTAAYLLVASPVPSQISSSLSGDNLTLSFPTASGQSYTILSCDDLTANLWVPYTNFTGNGSVLEMVAPVSTPPHRFFRLRQP
jgi:hypothetical protein